MTNIKLCLKKVKAHSGIEFNKYMELIKERYIQPLLNTSPLILTNNCLFIF